MSGQRIWGTAACLVVLGLCGTGNAQTQSAPAAPGDTGPTPAALRFYGGVEYLNWWVKGAPLSVPLVSTGPIATTHHGLLGPPAENGADSTVLYGAPHAPAQGGNDLQDFSGA